MTSEQTMLALALVVVLTAGCQTPQRATNLPMAYPQRQVLAVAPLRNESGSLAANGLIVADRLTEQLENAPNVDVLPVNRVLAAMEALDMAQVDSPQTAAQLIETLGADGLVVGTITAYDPYSPPKLGLAVELYAAERLVRPSGVDLTKLSRSATEDEGSQPPLDRGKPVTVVSGVYSAADAAVRTEIQSYAEHRGANGESVHEWRLYLISMDLFTEFVANAMSRRMLEAERSRLGWMPVERPSDTE